MFLNAKYCIDQGWLVGDISEENIQPNALDFTIDELYSINQNDSVLFTTNKDEIDIEKRNNQITPTDIREYNHLYNASAPSLSERRVVGWLLQPRALYIGRSKIKLNLPKNTYGILKPRSTFNRNGIFITSHVHDESDNYIEFLIVNNGNTCIEVGTRIGQILITQCDDVSTAKKQVIEKTINVDEPVSLVENDADIEKEVAPETTKVVSKKK